MQATCSSARAGVPPQLLCTGALWVPVIDDQGALFVCCWPLAGGGEGWAGRQAYGLNYWSRLLAPQPSAGGVQTAWTATPATLSPDTALEGPPQKQSLCRQLPLPETCASLLPAVWLGWGARQLCPSSAPPPLPRAGHLLGSPDSRGSHGRLRPGRPGSAAPA